MPDTQSNPIVEEEIETLQSIFGDDFQREVPKAWKGASSAASFTLKVVPEDQELKPHVYFSLHGMYSKTYPSAPATFTIKAPLAGLSEGQVKQLTGLIRDKAAAAAKAREVAVFDIHLFASEWIANNNTYNTQATKSKVVTKPKPTVSLAAEMKARNEQEAIAQHELAELHAHQIQMAEEERADRLAQEMKLDEQRREQKMRAERERKKARENLWEANAEDDPHIEKFSSPVTAGAEEHTFTSVRLGAPRPDNMGHCCPAEPIMEPNTATVPTMQLHSILFTSPYYARSQGRKRLREVEHELQGLVHLRHPGLLNIYAVELKRKPNLQNPNGQVLNILMESAPQVSLKEILEYGDGLRPDRVVDYLIQILSGLEALHDFKISFGMEKTKYCHRGLNAGCIGLYPSSSNKHGTQIKIGKLSYYARLMDQHRSNPFNGGVFRVDEHSIPRGWLSREAEDSPHSYSQRRDIWDVGVLALQMILGSDVMKKHETVWSALDALNSCPVSATFRSTITSMFDQNKKSTVTCTELLRKLHDMASDTPRMDHTPTPSHPEHHRSPSTPLASSRLSVDHFPALAASAQPPRPASRWRDEWEEIEFLGKGGFGSVVKARFKLDGAIYAVKKVKLRRQNDGKIYREANALSRLNHRFIVRYHTVWIESIGSASGWESPADSESSSFTNHHQLRSSRGSNGIINRPNKPIFRMASDFSLGNSFSSDGTTTTTFPSIHFGGEDDSSDDDDYPRTPAIPEAIEEEDDDGDDDDDDSDTTSQGSGTPVHSASGSRVGTPRTARSPSSRKSPAPWAPQMLYIQMEFVEHQTLKEAIEDGLSEKEAWRLFRQILEALTHIASLGIIHRDIKLTNIFIGANGDVKVGDFGLATSSLAQVDPSDVSSAVLPQSIEMTSGVGTALYLAPEVVSKGRGRSSHAKADMYSLGIVFFEMNWPPFETSTERIHVIQRLRLPAIIFPDTWEGREKQKIIITKLLQHNPAARPSAAELSNDNLLPEQEADAYFEEARRKIHHSEEQCETFVTELFQKRFDVVKQLSYDVDARPPEHAVLNDIVQEHVTKLFRLHGAVHKEPLLLVPITDLYDDEQQPVNLLDTGGRAVSLPRDHIVPFARSVISAKDLRTPVRVKRFHVGNVYFPSVTGKQPSTSLMAAVDIIHTDIVPGAAEAELLRMANECIDLFPGVSAHQFDIYISHSRIIETVFSRTHMDREKRRDVSVILGQSKTWQQKKTNLSRLGLPRVMVDELEVLSDDVDDVAVLVERLEKIGGPSPIITSAVDDVLRTMKLAQAMGVRRPITFRPLIMINQPYFREGIMFEVRGAKKNTDVVVRGGRYDHLITKFAGVTPKAMRAIGVQIALGSLTSTLADHLSVSVPRLLKEQRSFGYWSPSRCNVYIVSFQPGLLEERVELAAILWANGISADIMYESALDHSFGNADAATFVEMCMREGILFLVWYRPKTARRDHSLYKVKSLLRGTEYEVSPQDLVSWLTNQIAEQRRVDHSLAGGVSSAFSSAVPSLAAPRDTTTAGPDVQVIIGSDTHKKHQRNKMKVQVAEKAYAIEADLRSSIASGLPIISVELSGKALDILTSSSIWVTSDGAWKTLLSENKDELPAGICQQLREAILKRKAGSDESGGSTSLSGSSSHRLVGLMSVREDRLWVFKV